MIVKQIVTKQLAFNIDFILWYCLLNCDIFQWINYCEIDDVDLKLAFQKLMMRKKGPLYWVVKKSGATSCSELLNEVDILY